MRTEHDGLRWIPNTKGSGNPRLDRWLLCWAVVLVADATCGSRADGDP